AVSMSFGILFATMITLILVPVLYMLQQDFLRAAGWFWRLLLGRPEPDQVSASASTYANS
ncbi:MAG: hypothetical protein AAGA84_03110, partial [Pseudomonadota bacterium]